MNAGRSAEGHAAAGTVFLTGLEGDWENIQYPAKLLDGSMAEFTLSEIIMQLVTHGSHHRGQINTLIRQAGGQPPNTTFMGFCGYHRGR